MKKKLIRSGVFETNSSSSHSVSIADENKDFVLDMIYPNDEGIIVLFGGEFGWDWFKHNDALTKANYAAVAHKHNPDLVIEVIKEQTGADHVVLAFTSDYDGPDHYVAIIETHPLYDIGDIEPFNRRDLKPIINLKTCVNRELS